MAKEYAGYDHDEDNEVSKSAVVKRNIPNLEFGGGTECFDQWNSLVDPSGPENCCNYQQWGAMGVHCHCDDSLENEITSGSTQSASYRRHGRPTDTASYFYTRVGV